MTILCAAPRHGGQGEPTVSAQHGLDGTGNDCIRPASLGSITSITATDAIVPNAAPEGDLLEAAWGIIANAGWDGMAKSPGWQEAAVRWRDRYHAYLWEDR